MTQACEINLYRNNGFKWYSSNGLHIKGYFFLNGVNAAAEQVLDFLGNSIDKDDFIKKVLMINGCFSIVAELDSGVIAVSDTVRSFPMFYAEKDGKLYISDEGESIVSRTGYKKIFQSGLMDYLHSGVVFYNDTLIKGIKQISAMSCIYYDKASGKTKYIKYKEIYGAEYTVNSRLELACQLDSLFNNVSKRLVDSLNGRTAVLSLSGGVDSRSCLMMLKKMSYEDVICFTYGWKDSPEKNPAVKVAAQMGYKHIYIPHNKKQWAATYNDKNSLEYIRYAGNISSIAHMESHYAIRYLLDNNLIPKDSIVITGHIGLVASSKFSSGSIVEKSEIKEMFWKYWMKLYHYRGKRKKYYNNRFEKYFPSAGPYNCSQAEVIFENASFDSVRSKHIINSHRLYEMYGLEWRIPLMDYEFMSVFEKIKPGVRDKEKTVFTEYVMDYTGKDIKPAEYNLSYISKAVRNMRNPVYGIITPMRFLFSGRKNCLLPPFPVRQYRFLRRFYSYCALQEIKLIEGWLKEL